MSVLRSSFFATLPVRFHPETLPAGARFYRDGYRPMRSRIERYTVKAPSRIGYHLLRTLDRCGTGEASVTTGGRTLRFAFRAANTQFHSIYLPIFASGFETETGLLLHMLAGRHGTFFDIGSNWGHYSVTIGLYEGFEGRIHAFEPAAATYGDLVSVTTALGLSDRVTCHNLATGRTNAGGSLSIPDKVHSGIARVSASGGGETIRIARLDDLGLPTPTAMKIDVEGSEHDTLLGAEATLASARPFIVMESAANDAGTRPALALLERHRYRLFQPYLLLEGGAEDDPYPYDRPIPEGVAARLCLLPFEAAWRTLLQSHFNVFACPEEKLAVVERKLAAPSFAEAVATE